MSLDSKVNEFIEINHNYYNFYFRQAKAMLLGFAVGLGSCLYSPLPCYAEEIKQDKKIELVQQKVVEEVVEEVEKKVVSKKEVVNNIKVNPNIEFVRQLNLDSLENLISNIKYVKFHKLSKIKPEQQELDCKLIKDLVRLNDLAQVPKDPKIQDSKLFLDYINNTSKKLGYKKDFEKWNVPGFLRWNANLTRYWFDYNWFMLLSDSGVGLDVNGDGRRDGINFRAYLNLPLIRKQIIQNPDKYRLLSEKEEERVDNQCLDQQLKEVNGQEGKLKLVCRNVTTLLSQVFELTKERNPNLKNTFSVRVWNYNHMWNLFLTKNKFGVYATSVDITQGDNKNEEYSLRSDLDFYNENTHKSLFWEKGFVYIAAGTVLGDAGDYEGAVKIYNDGLKKYNHNFKLAHRLNSRLSYLYYRLGKYEEALVFLNKLKSTSAEAYGYYMKGLIYQKQKIYDKSYENYKKLITQKHFNGPFYDEALQQVGEVLFETKMYDEAIKQFNYCLEISPRSRDAALYYLAESYYHNKQEKLAKSNYEKFIKLYPGDDYVDRVKERLKYLEKIVVTNKS